MLLKYRRLSKIMDKLLTTRLLQLDRFHNNPILQPRAENAWEAKAVFNAGVIYTDKKICLFYRAMSADNTSVCGYATSTDGFNIEERAPEPVYVPREDFEKKCCCDANSGCEDPRLTQIGKTVYVCYTAYQGQNVLRVALTSIKLENLIRQKWDWTKPLLISSPKTDNKDAALFPKKINGKFAVLHRLGVSIWIDFVDNLRFENHNWLAGKILMDPRQEYKDNKKIGINGPPLETKYGWLLLYHGVSKSDGKYHLWASLLDLEDPTKIIARSDKPILEAEMCYEKYGIVPNVVFSNGAVIKDGQLFVYYGGADKVLGVATIKLSELMAGLLKQHKM